jgi:hypothetical protein
MSKLVLILIAFIAVVTFIRAFDNSAVNYSSGTASDGTGSEVIQVVVE